MNKTELLAALENGALVITPNKRLSKHLLDAFLYQKKVALKPLCYSYNELLHVLYNTIQHQNPSIALPLTLNPLQAMYLWKVVLAKATHSLNDGLFKAFQETWGRCHQWSINIDDPGFTHTTQTAQYQTLHLDYAKAIANHNALSESQLGDFVRTHLRTPPAKEIIWVCFNDFTPQQVAFQETLSQLGCTSSFYEAEQNTNPSYLVPCQNEQHELETMISWVKERLAADEECIGVVFPELHKNTHSIRRFFKRHLADEEFNISLAQPLIEHSLIAHALLFLELSETISYEHARILLSSPYLLGAQEEFLARHELLNHALLQEPTILLSSLIGLCQQKTPILGQLLENLTPLPSVAENANWPAVIKSRLIQVGFPGQQGLQPFASQLLDKFLESIDELFTLTLIAETSTQEEILGLLQNWLAAVVFQPKKEKARVHILGLLEASGLEFDSLWVCGATAHGLVGQGGLSPFIPIPLQRKQQMPFADENKELILAERNITRLQYLSNISIFSYPALKEDIAEQPYPLLQKLPLLTLHVEKLVFNSALVEQEEDFNLPLHPEELIYGGTAILSNQAKCPFRAFAAHRLHAFSPNTSYVGLNPMERGQIIHAIMELVWHRLKTQHVLLTLSEQDQESIVNECIQIALKPFLSNPRHSFAPLIQEVEESRLQKLVNGCLQWERQRPSFEVFTLEQGFTIELAGIQFNLRVDRLDTVGDKKWVIDYKSSLPMVKPWYDPRPEEPQLLLYALLDDSINALLFLQMKTGSILCNGISEENHGVKEIQTLKDTDWSTQRASWQSNLEQLAQEFSQGICTPRPTRDSLCLTCEYSELCRIGDSGN